MDAITVYSRYQNLQTRKEEWHRTVLSGTRWNGKPAVHWENNEAANVLTSGLSTADAVFAMIWLDADAQGKAYLPAKRFAALAPEDVNRYWTLEKAQTRLVRGIGIELAEGMSIKDVAAASEACMTAMHVDTMDYGDVRMHHFEVSGR